MLRDTIYPHAVINVLQHAAVPAWRQSHSTTSIHSTTFSPPPHVFPTHQHITPANQHRLARVQAEAGIKSAALAEEGAAGAASGSGGISTLLDELLEGEFDPEEYDRRMAAAFDETYYEVWVMGAAHWVCCIAACVILMTCRCIL